MNVHESLRPGMVRVTGAAIEKEFAQFAFSLLLEILDACLVSVSYIRQNPKLSKLEYSQYRHT